MAGDWIQMRVDLAEDPAVISMASDLGVHETHVVGMLHKCWSWADRHAKNGHAHSVTGIWLDTHIGVAGFSRAMENAGWLVVDNGLKFPDFDHYNGNSAKKRALTTKRKRKERESHAPVTKMSRIERDKSVTREEKRREELKTNTAPPSAGLFELACKLYPNRKGNDPPSRARKAWDAQLKRGTKAEDMVEGVKRYAAFCAVTGKMGTEFVLQRATFFGPDQHFLQAFDPGPATPAPPPGNGADVTWWKSNDGIGVKGKALGIPYPPASQQVAGWFNSYKLRVFAKAGRGPWMDLLPERLRSQVEASMGAEG